MFHKLSLHPWLIKFAYKFFDLEASNEVALPSSRIIEYSFIIDKLSKMPPGRVLDVGCTARFNVLPAILAKMGWEVWGIDIRTFRFKHSNFHMVKGDITNMCVRSGSFNAAYSVSTIETLGMKGRYGIVKEDLEADMKAMMEISRVLQKGGTFLVTLPYAKKFHITKPLGRIYDRESLQKLFLNWRIKEKVIYIQDAKGCWLPATENMLEKGKKAIVTVEAVYEADYS
jgi:ubiquinone/menaquinone biosynthesis C-methylase UbiE